MSVPVTGVIDPALAAALAASSAVGVQDPAMPAPPAFVPGMAPAATAAVEMPTGNMVMPSGVKQSFNAALPALPFVCRAKRAVYHTPSDAAKAANRNIQIDCEIMSPDIVSDPMNPAVQVKAAGRVFSIYVPIAIHMKNIDNAFDILGRLQLLEENGGFTPDKVKAILDQGGVWFQCLIITEPEFFMTKGMDGKDAPVVGPDGKPILKGFRIKLPEPSQIIGRVETPPGFEPPKF